MSDQPEQQWWCREGVTPGYDKAKAMKADKVWAELVYGHWEKGKCIGKAFHILHGPTAAQSIQAYAEDLNMRRVPPTEAPEFGPAKASHKDPNQMSLLLMMKPDFKDNQ